MKNRFKNIIKFFKTNLMLTPIINNILFGMLIIYNIILLIIEIPFLSVVILGAISIFSVKEFILTNY